MVGWEMVKPSKQNWREKARLRGKGVIFSYLLNRKERPNLKEFPYFSGAGFRLDGP